METEPISFAWAATTSPAISLAGSVSKQPPSPSIESLTQSADEAANSGDYWTALSLYRRLAEKGDARAQYKLGAMVQDENLKEAAKWYQLAAAQGHAAAQYALGAMYEDGRGVPQDEKEAMKWYELAAAQGYEEAEYRLGKKAPPAPPVVQQSRNPYGSDPETVPPSVESRTMRGGRARD